MPDGAPHVVQLPGIEVRGRVLACGTPNLRGPSEGGRQRNVPGRVADEGQFMGEGRALGERNGCLGRKKWMCLQHEASWNFGYTPGRRREHAIIIQQVLSWRLAKLRVSAFKFLYDIKNAFWCLKNKNRNALLAKIIMIIL